MPTVDPSFTILVVLGVLLAAYLRSGAGCRRIDGTLVVALALILWFSIVPVSFLLRTP